MFNNLFDSLVNRLSTGLLRLGMFVNIEAKVINVSLQMVHKERVYHTLGIGVPDVVAVAAEGETTRRASWQWLLQQQRKQQQQLETATTPHRQLEPQPEPEPEPVPGWSIPPAVVVVLVVVGIVTIGGVAFAGLRCKRSAEQKKAYTDVAAPLEHQLLLQ